MKRFVIIGTMAVLISCVSQAQIRFGGGVHGGIAFSSFPKDVKDYFGTGFDIGAHVDMSILKYLGLRLSADYYGIPSDKSKVGELLVKAFTVGGQPADAAKTTVSGYNSRDLAIYLNAIGRLSTGMMVTPYATLGFGVNILSASDMKVEYSGLGDITQDLTNLGIISKPETKTKMGMNAGAGAEFKLGILVLYAEFKYVLVFTEGGNTSLLPITIGVTITP